MLRRLVSAEGGLGVPDLLVGEVRVRTKNAAWISCGGEPYLLAEEYALRGPLTALVGALEDLEPGDDVEVRTTGSRFRGWSAPAQMGPVATDSLPLSHSGVAKRASWLGKHSLQSVAKGLAGLGPGLTPSGDDVLTGYILVRHAAAWPSFEREAATILDAMRSGSGEPALSLAEWAARGESFAIALEARDELFGAGAGAMARLEELGSETGRAMLVGMVAGLRAGYRSHR